MSECQAISIPEVQGLNYLDKVENYARKPQAAPVSIVGEVDRVYLDPPPAVSFEDPQRPGTIAINAWGNTDLVVWNPGPAVAAAMADFDDEGYRSMVCIEPAIALDNRRLLAPQESFSVGQTIEWVCA